MYWQQWIVLLSAMGASLFAAFGVQQRRKRLRMLLPAVLLALLALYELYMIHWEKTVIAPIRLDLFAEIPLMFILLVWGVIAAILPARSDKA
jgi:hypothetical protein